MSRDESMESIDPNATNANSSEFRIDSGLDMVATYDNIKMKPNRNIKLPPIHSGI